MSLSSPSRSRRGPVAVVLALFVVCSGAIGAGTASAVTPADPAWTVHGWGDAASGGTVPDELAGQAGHIVSVAAGFDHSLALTSEGSVVGWGNDSSGQATPPAGLRGVSAISAGKGFSLALRSDGTVVGWGANSFGQATPPVGLNDVTAISAGDDFAVALKRDGSMAAWGDNSSGQAMPPVVADGVTAISAGGEFGLALRRNGTIVSWGAEDEWQRKVPDGLGDVAAISAGHDFGVALKRDGSVVGWGAKYWGKVSPLPPKGLADVKAISAGYDFGIAVKDNGALVGWGNNDQGQVAMTPRFLDRSATIAAGRSHGLAITHNALAPVTPIPHPPALPCGALPSDWTDLSLSKLDGNPRINIRFTSDGNGGLRVVFANGQDLWGLYNLAPTGAVEPNSDGTMRWNNSSDNGWVHLKGANCDPRTRKVTSAEVEAAASAFYGFSNQLVKATRQVPAELPRTADSGAVAGPS